jgi:hypothetical protein
VIARAPAIAVLLFAAAGSFVSILARWPYQFTGPGSPGRVPEESLLLGTLLGPPIALLVLFGVAVLLAPRADRTGFVATVALVPILLTMVVGSIGEAASPRSPDVPHPVQLWGGLIGAAAYLGLLVAVIWALHRRRWRPTKGRRVSS